MELKMPLNQHIGMLSRPVVRVGDRVEKGELIAEIDQMGSNIHSSVYGKVEKVDSEVITIKPFKKQPSSYQKIPTANKLDMIKSAGLVDQKGFPLYFKYNTIKEGAIFILDCSFSTDLADISFLKNNQAKLKRGISYIKELTSFSQGYILINNIKAQNYDIFNLLKQVTKDSGLKFSLKSKESQLKSLKQRLDATELVLESVEVIKRLVEAIEERKPYISKDLTVNLLNNSKNIRRSFFDLPLGLPLKYFSDKYCLDRYQKSFTDDAKLEKEVGIITKKTRDITFNKRESKLLERSGIVEAGYVRTLNTELKEFSLA